VSENDKAVNPQDDATDTDVPYGEDLQSASGAKAWADAADTKRPQRLLIRAAIVERLRLLPPGAHVLELGSGPGLLAEAVLAECTQLANYTLLDFSEPMLDMSRARLRRFSTTTFVLGDFRSNDWVQRAEGPYQAIVSTQAVHEVRHKRHVPRLYRQIHTLLTPNGSFLIADRTPEDDSARSRALFMTEDEQVVALASAGFVDVRVVMVGDALVLCESRKPSDRTEPQRPVNARALRYSRVSSVTGNDGRARDVDVSLDPSGSAESAASFFLLRGPIS
jgi:SAM-dependent methyltransferase